jgi:hypothetical protein
MSFFPLIEVKPQNAFGRVWLRAAGARVARFFLVDLTKMGKTYQTDNKIYQTDHKIYQLVSKNQMDIKYIKIFHSKALKSIPKLEFWFQIYHLATLAWASRIRVTR